jgi:hypothetical protein
MLLSEIFLLTPVGRVTFTPSVSVLTDAPVVIAVVVFAAGFTYEVNGFTKKKPSPFKVP